MSSRPSVKSAFENLRPTIMREPSRSPISAEAEARLLDKPEQALNAPAERTPAPVGANEEPAIKNRSTAPLSTATFATGTLLQKKKRERLLLVSFRMPQELKEKLELAAKTHELNQTDLINEAIELNLQRYL